MTYIIYIATQVLTGRPETKRETDMENNFKIRIDQIVEDLGKIQDLNIKIDILNYMEGQAAFLLWQLEEEKRIDENSRNV